MPKEKTKEKRPEGSGSVSIPVDKKLRDEEREILAITRSSSPTFFERALSGIPSMFSASLANDDMHVLLDYQFGELVHSQDNFDHQDDQEDVKACEWEAGCNRKLGKQSSKFECPVCKRIFCSSHAGHPTFEVSLAGRWVRACRGCWWSRMGRQEDGSVVERRWDLRFGKRREAFVEARRQHIATLRERLSKVPRNAFWG